MVPNFPNIISTATKEVGRFRHKIIDYLIPIYSFWSINKIYHILRVPTHFKIATIMVTLR